MVELIVTIFAGLGFFSLVHFSVHLIEKMNKNIKSITSLFQRATVFLAKILTSGNVQTLLSGNNLKALE